MGVHVTVDDSKAQKLLLRMEARSRNLMPVLRDAKSMLEQSNRANFTAQGLPSGSRWAARRSEATWPLMRRTGKLFQSLAQLNGPANDIGLQSATFGTSIEYARFHQNGTRKMPKRLVVFEPLGFKVRLGRKAANHIIGMRQQLFS